MVDVTLEDIATTLAECKEFMDYVCSISAEGAGGGLMSQPRKAALAMWTIYYRPMINVPGSIVERFLPLIR